MELSCLCFLLGFLTRDLLGHRNSITSYGSLDSNGSRWEYNRNPLHLLRQFQEQIGAEQEPTPSTQVVICIQGVFGVDGSTIETQSVYSGSYIGNTWSRWKYNRNSICLLRQFYRQYRSRWDYNRNPLKLLRQL